MAKIRYDYDDIELRGNIEELRPKVHRAVSAVADYTALEGTGYMKETAPWTDRTGAARAGLHAVASSKPGRHEIVFAGSVHYQIWLEIANSGRYQVIMPAVRHEGQLMMERLRGLLPRLTNE